MFNFIAKYWSQTSIGAAFIMALAYLLNLLFSEYIIAVTASILGPYLGETWALLVMNTVPIIFPLTLAVILGVVFARQMFRFGMRKVQPMESPPTGFNGSTVDETVERNQFFAPYDLKSRFSLNDASWLWMNIEPQDQYFLSTKPDVYAIYHALSEAISVGDLVMVPEVSSSRSRFTRPDKTPEPYRKVTRDNLRKWAETTEQRPMFLFREER